MARSSAHTRDRLIATTQELMQRQGYHATGLNQIVDESQAPKGSLYHYFPGGKEELAVTALRQSATELEALLRSAVNNSPDTRSAFHCMGAYVIEKLKTTSFAQACPISTVALETAHQSDALQAVCSEAFAAMQGVMAEGFRRDGYSDTQATELAMLLICSYLGSLVLSRTHQTTAPIESVVQTLGSLLPPIH
jgi:TetR/AcrR family transcriptional repressor of lmrAB and yxaGH operons